MPPTSLPTVEPTYVMGTVVFSAGDATEGQETPLFKYVPSNGEFQRLAPMDNQVVAGLDIARMPGDIPTFVYFTDSYRESLFRVPLTGENTGTATLVTDGCTKASALTIPQDQDYVYFSCRGFTDYPSASIMRVRLNTSDVEMLAENMGAITSMTADEYFLYFVTAKGEYKYIDLAGSGYQRVAFDIKSPTGLVLNAKRYMKTNVLYLSTPNAIYRMSLDGVEKTKIIGGLYACSGLALDLSHGRMMWTDNAAGSIWESDLDGSNIRAVLNVKYGYKVQYYTDTASQFTGRPSHTPSHFPTPEPTISSMPSLAPSPFPSHMPTPAPSYYSGRLYFTAGASTSGSFLYMSKVGSFDSPDQLTHAPGGSGALEQARGVAYSEDPNFVFWINSHGNAIYRVKMDAPIKTADKIFTSDGFPLYDLVASSHHIYVTSGKQNSITRMRHDGSSAATLTVGIDKVSGIDYASYRKGNKLFFASRAEKKVYSMKEDGSDRTVLLQDVEANSVVYDREFNKLYVICDTEVLLTSKSGSDPVTLISGFTRATSAAIQYGEHRIWITDYGSGHIYQAQLDGSGVSVRMSLPKPRYIVFFASAAADSHAPSFFPSPAPTKIPTGLPTSLPSVVPTAAPTSVPSMYPSEAPTTTPTPEPTATPSFLFYATGEGDETGVIHRASTDGSNSEVFYSGGGLPTGLAVHNSGRSLYWTDVANGAIYRTNVVDGGSGAAAASGAVETMVTGLSYPKRLAVSLEGSADTSGPHLFWSDPTEGKLYRSDLNGGNVVTLVSGATGISGVTTTYDYVYYTVPAANTLYRVGFDGSSPSEVLLDVCDSPDDLSYSPQTFVMYCSCATSILSVTMYKQQGGYENPLQVLLTGVPGSGLNTVLYNWDAAGLYFCSDNASKLHFMPMDDIYGQASATATTGAYDLSSSLEGGGVADLLDVGSPRSVAMFDPALATAGFLTQTAQTLLKDPATVFAAPDDDGSQGALTDARTVLPMSDGSAPSPVSRQALFAAKESEEAAAPSSESQQHSSALLFAGAGAFAVFAAVALGGRHRRPDEGGAKKGFVPRVGYSALN